MPADLSDPYLEKWVKPQINPFLFQVGALNLDWQHSHSKPDSLVSHEKMAHALALPHSGRQGVMFNACSLDAGK